jgi:hypothetical protein
MPEPEDSNRAQERQEKESAADIARARATHAKLGAVIGPAGSGAVSGGEETKPGQMAGDEDISPNAPQDEIETAAVGKSPTTRG